MTDLFLTSYVGITTKGLWLNGKLVVLGGERGLGLLRDSYDYFDLKYPKFFKMDNLCKLGILATEPFFKSGELLNEYKEDEIALLLANKSSSLESDLKHAKNYQEGMASPAVFVYTLPNIVIGEICIKHQLLGESNFYIFEGFNAGELIEQAKVLLTTTQSKACIVGWVEKTAESFEVLFFLFEKEGINKVDIALLENIKNEQEHG